MSIAEKMASNQKQIAISEFFEKNKHFLGFDTLNRAIITAVKEAVDNSLDACEEARILPDITIEIQRVPKSKDQLILIAMDNGPGIPQKSIENVFGKLLYGSRFHAIRQSRGQQGIGITGVVMYSQLTTGKQTYVKSKIASESSAVEVNLGIDTRKNKAVKYSQERVIWTEGDQIVEHGLFIRTQMKAKFQRGSQSIVQYLKMTSIVNPHANITFRYINSDGELEIENNWKRATNNLPTPVKAIKPHPHGIHLGQLQRMLKDSDERKLTSFLRQNFSGVSSRAAKEVCTKANLSDGAKPKLLKTEQVNSLLDACSEVKFLPPPTNCLSPIEDLLIKKGLSKTIDSKFVTTLTRNPCVASGNPYQIEVGLIFGGSMPSDQQVQLLRFANRVPLMYQQGGCLLTQAISSIDWRQYGLEQSGGKGVPKGPATILVHLASTNVQFTSEAKEAVASNDNVMQEIRKALLELGRNLRRHMKKKKKMAKAQEKFDLINDILPAIAEKASSLLGKPVPELSSTISKIMNAVIMEQNTYWDKDTKTVRVAGILYNYTSRPRSYTILMNWPEKQGAVMIDNDRGGRKETIGLWAWKIETLQPGERANIEFGLDNLEKGDWTETEVFYRGSAEVIGASKLDEKILEEMKNQNSDEVLETMEVITEDIDETISNVASRAMLNESNNDEIQKESFQTTLFEKEGDE